MNCPEITNLTFSPSGVKAINEIRRKQALGKALIRLIGSSVLIDIFVGRTGVEGPLAAAYNIAKADWEAWPQAMVSVNPMIREQVQMIAFDESQKEYSGKEHEFWKAVADGCGY